MRLMEVLRKYDLISYEDSYSVYLKPVPDALIPRLAQELDKHELALVLSWAPGTVVHLKNKDLLPRIRSILHVFFKNPADRKDALTRLSLMADNAKTSIKLVKVKEDLGLFLEESISTYEYLLGRKVYEDRDLVVYRKLDEFAFRKENIEEVCRSIDEVFEVLYVLNMNKLSERRDIAEKMWRHLPVEYLLKTGYRDLAEKRLVHVWTTPEPVEYRFCDTTDILFTLYHLHRDGLDCEWVIRKIVELARTNVFAKMQLWFTLRKTQVTLSRSSDEKVGSPEDREADKFVEEVIEKHKLRDLVSNLDARKVAEFMTEVTRAEAEKIRKDLEEKLRLLEEFAHVEIKFKMKSLDRVVEDLERGVDNVFAEITCYVTFGKKWVDRKTFEDAVQQLKKMGFRFDPVFKTWELEVHVFFSFDLGLYREVVSA